MRTVRAAMITLLAGGTLLYAFRDTRLATRIKTVMRERTMRRIGGPEHGFPRMDFEPSQAPSTEVPIDVASIDDPVELVEAERELLTAPGLPGESHRRRDQTAGRAAQQIAAAQVRSRRNANSA